MPPLVALAVSLLPSLAKRVVDNVLPDVETKITEKVRDVLGTSDPEKAAEKVLDPQVAAQLRLHLAEIEAEADKREQELQVTRLRTQFQTFKAQLEDTAGARTMLTTLSGQGSVIAWGPVIVSTIVVTGFFVILVLLMFRPDALAQGENAQLVFQILNIAIGALTAGFATVVSFWLGSSQGSRNKDENARQGQALLAGLQRDNAQSTTALIDQQSRQTAALINKVGSSQATIASPHKKADKSARWFHRCVDVILLHEGGFAQHPDDPGGATNFGITHKTLAAWRKVEACTPEEVRALEIEEAKEIYRAFYWNALNCDQLPRGVDLVTFDFGVNAGVNRSARTLQNVVAVKADGQVGPITIGAAQRMDSEYVINKMSDMRLDFYKTLKHWDVFGKGWARRTADVREIAHEMEKEEF